MFAWILPDHIADVLFFRGSTISEELGVEAFDTARSYGYELVIPARALDSLLTGSG